MALRRTGYKAGDEVDSKCTRCKMELAHTVVALVGDAIARVKCNTCGGEHAYRAPLTASEATAKKRRAERKASSIDKPGGRATASDFDILTKGKDLTNPSSYNPKMQLTRDDVLKHPTFGVGLVTELREGLKAHVIFPEGGRVLIYGRAAKPA